tara:strand:+ start:665 stop:967 length:303 start_codon:yes stop_codon:yes gene_type:complete
MIRHKFNAKPTEHDGIKFASKKESRRYQELRVLESAGDIRFFLRQTPIHLSGGVKYVCDFLIFWSDGTVTFEDVKGYKTDLYKLKKKQVEATYPITIRET